MALVDEDAREQRGDGVDGGRAGGDDARDGQRQLGDVGQKEQEERRLESRGYREAYLGHPQTERIAVLILGIVSPP